METGQHDHSLTCHVHKGKVTGVYVGYLEEIPGIMVYSPTKDGIHEKIKQAVAAYFDAFPKQHDVVFNEQTMIKPEHYTERISVSV